MRNAKLALGALVLLALSFTVGCQSEADRKMDAIQAVAVATWNAAPHAKVVTPEIHLSNPRVSRRACSAHTTRNNHPRTSAARL
jgi:hypothetical protein